MGVKFLANAAVIIATYFLTYHIYNGVLNPSPPLGDSWDYHIPIAYTIINGSFLNPDNFLLPQWYYPGSGEFLNVLLLITGLPLSFSNLISTVVLFFVLLKLGTSFRLEKYYALIFALSFVTLNGVVRWLNFALVDVWVAVFFVSLLILLESPKKSVSYFLKLGFFSGMLIGSKYTAVFFLIPLFIFYIKTFRFLNLKNIIAFLTPFFIFGIFWYVRNFYSTGNPFFPLPILGFSGDEIFAGYRVWNISLEYPTVMLDSLFAEFKLWAFLIPLSTGFIILNLLKRTFKWDTVTKLFLLGLINFLIFLNFPTSPEPWIMVSSFRYSYPVFIPLFLGVFLLFKKIKHEEILGYFTISNMIFVTSLHYYPKLTFIFVPLSFIFIWILNRKK